jgi:hypothetical protein
MTAKVDHLVRLLESPEPAEVLRRIDRLVAQLNDVPPALLAKALMAKSIDISLAAMGTLATVHIVNRAGDLLGGHWSPESIAMFIES